MDGDREPHRTNRVLLAQYKDSHNTSPTATRARHHDTTCTELRGETSHLPCVFAGYRVLVAIQKCSRNFLRWICNVKKHTSHKAWKQPCDCALGIDCFGQLTLEYHAEIPFIAPESINSLRGLVRPPYFSHCVGDRHRHCTMRRKGLRADYLQVLGLVRVRRSSNRTA